MNLNNYAWPSWPLTRLKIAGCPCLLSQGCGKFFTERATCTVRNVSFSTVEADILSNPSFFLSFIQQTSHTVYSPNLIMCKSWRPLVDACEAASQPMPAIVMAQDRPEKEFCSSPHLKTWKATLFISWNKDEARIQFFKKTSLDANTSEYLKCRWIWTHQMSSENSGAQHADNSKHQYIIIILIIINNNNNIYIIYIYNI